MKIFKLINCEDMDVPIQPLTLDQLLQYANPKVVRSFVDTFDITIEDAEKIFHEMLRFFWLSESSDDKDLRTIDSPLTVIDEMWHIFILHTVDYHQFCATYFGHYLHHCPATPEEKEESIIERRNGGELTFKEEKKRKYDKIFEILGQDVFITWYLDFPARFSKRALFEKRKQ